MLDLCIPTKESQLEGCTNNKPFFISDGFVLRNIIYSFHDFSLYDSTINSDGNLLHQYQQNEQLPLILTH